MDDIGCGGWFLLFIANGILVTISIETGTNILLLYLCCGLLVGIGVLIHVWIKNSREEKKINQSNELKAQFPLAYNQFLKELNKGRLYWQHYSELEIAEKAIARSRDVWENKECQLQQEEKEKKEQARRISKIVTLYPNGIKKWKQENRTYTNATIIQNTELIRQYEEYYSVAAEYDKWELEQSVFSQKCRDIGPGILSSFGFYKYHIPFNKKNEDGGTSEGNYLVWQFFAGSYCTESDLDYSDVGYVKRNTDSIVSFKNKKYWYNKSVYERINNFVLRLASENDVSVFLCVNNKEWTIDTLYFHYVEKSAFEKLRDSVEIYNPFEYNVYYDDYDIYEYPVLHNRHIVIIEMQTNNEHLQEVCKKIIEENMDKRPLITYISLFKGYDRDEMQKIISDKKKEQETEQERIRKEKEDAEREKRELEQFKPCKGEILKILNDNNIKCFYHFTSADNLDSIRRNGGLYSWWSLQQKKIDVPFLGGEGFGQQLDVRHGLQDYVRLSFCDDHPMIFRHQQNGIRLVLLQIDIEVATWKDTLFSDINATDNNHHHGGGLEDLKMVDFDAVKRNYVSREDDEFKPHQAEVMVKTFIPINYITNINSPHYL